jgi:hypothetical protein
MPKFEPSPILLTRLKKMALPQRISYLLRWLDSSTFNSDLERQFLRDHFERELQAISWANSHKEHSQLLIDCVAVYRFTKLLRTKLYWRRGKIHPRYSQDLQAWIHGGAQAVVRKHYKHQLTLEHAHLYHVTQQRYFTIVAKQLNQIK